MSILLTSMSVLVAVVLVCVIVKARAKLAGVAVRCACICLAFVIIFLFHQIEVSLRENWVGTSSPSGVPQIVRQDDEKFLDDLVQEQTQNVQRETNPGTKPGPDVAAAERDGKPVPRAELIVNTSRVRRAQLVVNSRVLERGELVRPKYQ